LFVPGDRWHTETRSLVSLVSRCSATSCRDLLVEKTDRLYRNLQDWMTRDELDLEINFVKEGFVLCED
jgi:hypothetical protein